MKVNIRFGLTIVRDITAIKFVISTAQTKYDDPNVKPKSTYNVTAIIVSDHNTIRETVETTITDKNSMIQQIESVMDKIENAMLSDNSDEVTVRIY